MKVSISEFRDILSEAIRRVVAEARKPKLLPPRSEESIEAELDRQVRAQPGTHHSQPNDYAKPLGSHNLTKRQGAAGMGNWTSEAVQLNQDSNAPVRTTVGDLIKHLTMNGVDAERAAKIVNRMVQPGAQTGLDDPSELGIEAKTEAVKRLVRMVVDEEIRVHRGR